MLEYLLFAAYMLIGPLAWLGVGIALVKGRKRMNLLHLPIQPPPGMPPRVSILIPAKDEGVRIRQCLQSALDQDYGDFQVIAIDDRSTDHTGQVMEQMAQVDARLQALHIRDGELPEGWTGKCNALHRGAGHADGQWLLFVDSDVILQPDAVRSTVAFAINQKCDLLSLMPRLESHTSWEEMLVPLAGGTLSSCYLVPLTNNNHLPHVAFANGQYLLISRPTYEKMGGHAAVRNKFCEDIAIARLLKPAGHKIRISWGTQFAAVRMYSSLSAIFRGWARIFFAAGLGRPWRMLAAIGFLTLSVYSVYPALAWSFYRGMHPIDIFGGWGWLGAALAHFTLMSGSVGMLYTWTGNRRRWALLLPVAAAMVIAILLRALLICLTGKLEWRGTRYSQNHPRQTV